MRKKMKTSLNVLLLFILILFSVEGKSEGPGVASESYPADEITFVEAIKEISVRFEVFFTFDLKLVEGIMVDESFRNFNTVENAVEFVLQATSLKYRIIQTRYVIIYKDDVEGLESLRQMSHHLDGLISEGEKASEEKQKRRSSVVQRLIPRQMNHEIAPFSFSVEGRIVDQDGQPLIGVNVLVKGTNKGTATDFEGRFVLDDVDEKAILVVSYVGYQTKEVPVAGKPSIEITLLSDTHLLDELIVVGYSTIKKADLTGSVSVVSSEEIKNNQYTNVLKALQGKVPGMYITADGDPTGRAGVRIRGITSVNANPPLIVLDGMPTQLNLSDINSADIASIQILKDASSASIYGSRAASGVILIETKKGRVGKTNVEYQGSAGYSTIMHRPQMMNTIQYGEAFWRAAINDGLDPGSQTLLYTYDWDRDADGNPQLHAVFPRKWLNREETMPSADTDWFDEVLQNGFRQQHQLSITSGSEKSRSLFSVNYFQNDGTVIHSGLKRYTLRLNSDYNLIDGLLRVGENISVSHKVYRGGVNSSIRNMLIMPPIVPVYTNDGEWGGTAYAYGMDDYNNPVRELTINKDNKNRDSKLMGSVFAELNPLEGLVLKTQVGLNYSRGYFRHINYTWEEGGGKRDIRNGINNYYGNSMNFTFTNTANYDFSIIQDHNFSVLGGIEMFKHKSENFATTRLDIQLEDRDFAYLNSATGNLSAGGSGNELSMISYFSKLNYNYKSKYLLSATMRYDGSSVFGANNRYALFPALSLGWRISDETFFDDITALSELKIRASWGINGNSNIPSTARFNYYDSDYFETAYAIKGQENGQLASGYRRIQTGNEDLKWEETEQYTVGLDYGMFDGRLSGSLDIYHKITTGMLFFPPFLGASGEGAGQWYNAADMSNQGVEFLISYANDPNKAFNYSIGLNLSSNKNRIDNLPEEVRFAYGGNGVDEDIQGLPLRSFYGFVADGIFKSEQEVEQHATQRGKGIGRIRYKDLNNDGQITWQEDRKWLGNSDPKLMYGFDFKFSYKNFNLSMFWQGVAGGLVRNDWKTYSDFWNVWTQAGFNHEVRVLDAWSPANPDSDIPALSLSNANDERRLSSYYLEYGDYLKLRDIELGYDLPAGILRKIRAQNCRLYISAQNMINIKRWWGDHVFTGHYPETATKGSEYSNPYMRPQIFSTGVNITF